MFSTPAPVEARLTRAFAALALIWLATLLVWLQVGDAGFAHWFAAPPFNTRWRIVSSLLSDWGMVGFYLLFLGVLARGLARDDRVLRQIGLAYLLAQIVGSLLLVRLIKMGCGRPRPGAEEAGMAFCTGPNVHSSFHAFPSGHTTDLIVSALFVAIFVRSRSAGVVAMLLALGVAMSRVVLGSHHMSDVLAGALLGMIIVWLTLQRYLLPRWRVLGNVGTRQEARADTKV
jgi:membrane-associated phospholipid phosphatase